MWSNVSHDLANGYLGTTLRGRARMSAPRPSPAGGRAWYLLFLVQFAVALYPPLYNKIEPTLWGIPFFYWFQLAWVLVSAVLTAIVYFVRER